MTDRTDIRLLDAFWAPRQAQLRDHTLEVILERLEAQGVLDNFRRLAGRSGNDRQAMHFSDSDLYKWMEAAALAGRHDLLAEPIELVEAVQAPDGYVHTYYGVDGLPARYSDLAFGHEQYCAGHLVEAAVTHHAETGSDQLLRVARAAADHLLATFGPGRDERVDGHPEIELALCRLAAATGEGRYVEHAAWVIERQLDVARRSLETFTLSGHAVRALYLASGIAEVALAGGGDRWAEAARRLFDSLLAEHSYPTGAVGGRWLGEMVGKPYEQPDAMSYTESCAAVAALQLCERIWRLCADPRALDHAELLLFNAVACGVGADGESWFYSQPHAVAEVADDPNVWDTGIDYGALMLRQWFPARRHRWFLVPCCPPNLARTFAGVHRHVAELDPAGDLLVHLPVAARITAPGWDVEVTGRYPDHGDVAVIVHQAPAGRAVRVRRPGWAGGAGHEPPGTDGSFPLPVDWSWWTSDHRVEGAGDTVHLRLGPVVHCVEGLDVPGTDLRDLVVDPARPPAEAFRRRTGPAGPLHRPVAERVDDTEAVTVRTTPYAEWANRGMTTMRTRFARQRE